MRVPFTRKKKSRRRRRKVCNGLLAPLTVTSFLPTLRSHIHGQSHKDTRETGRKEGSEWEERERE